MDRDKTLDAVRDAAALIIAPAARSVDEEDRFPSESVDVLRDLGLFAHFVPRHLGGSGASVAAYAEISEELGRVCLSTAVIWAMHSQQVAVLAAHGGEDHHAALSDVAEAGSLIASVTTESGGGDLKKVEARLESDCHQITVRRFGPAVSFGHEADHFLVTMRDEEAPGADQVRLIRLHRSDGGIEMTKPLQMLGMRGTQTASMRFDTTVPSDRVLPTSFREIANHTMIPLGHVGWSAAWLGAVRQACEDVVRLFRGGHQSGGHRISSDHVRIRLARLRLNVDLIEALLGQCVRTLDRHIGKGTSMSTAEHVAVNNLKVAAADLSVETMNGLFDLAGMSTAYVRGTTPPLGRVLRDLRSAPLMVHNDRILAINARLILTQSSAMFRPSRAPGPRPAEVT